MAANSIEELAAVVGVSTKAVQTWLRRPDWTFPSEPPWDEMEVIAWRKQTIQRAGPGRLSADAMADAARNPEKILRMAAHAERWN